MRTTVTLDDQLLAQAQELCGPVERPPAGSTRWQPAGSAAGASSQERRLILVDTSIWVDHLRSGMPQLMAERGPSQWP